MTTEKPYEDKVYERSRELGYVVSNWFKKAIVSYRGLNFRVDLVESDDSFKMDEESYTRLKRKFEHSAFKNDFELPASSENLNIYVPSKILCTLSDLDELNCQNDQCGRLWKQESIRSFSNHCTECGGTAIRNAPVFVGQMMASSKRTRRVPREESETIIPLYRGYGRKCPCGEWYNHLVVTNREEPLFSLRYVCKKCGNMAQLNPPRKGQYRYSPRHPSQSLITGMTASVGKPSNVIASLPESVWKEILPGLISFEFSKLEIYQITFGYGIGEFGNKEKYLFSTNDPEKFKAFGRKFTTSGFVLKVNPKVFIECQQVAKDKAPELEKDPDHLKKVVLHTLKHAILAYMPIYTGLEPQKFSGGYDFTSETAEVFIYDSESGGTGGCISLFEDKERLKSVLQDAKMAVLECRRGNDVCPGYCKRCIYIENCGEINLDLNRYVTQPLFGALQFE